MGCCNVYVPYKVASEGLLAIPKALIAAHRWLVELFWGCRLWRLRVQEAPLVATGIEFARPHVWPQGQPHEIGFGLLEVIAVRAQLPKMPAECNTDTNERQPSKTYRLRKHEHICSATTLRWPSAWQQLSLSSIQHSMPCTCGAHSGCCHRSPAASMPALPVPLHSLLFPHTLQSSAHQPVPSCNAQEEHALPPQVRR